jgi:phosphoserine phosphatase
VLRLSQHGWAASDAVAIGDGTKEISMIELAGLGGADRAKPKIKALAGAAVAYQFFAIRLSLGFTHVEWILFGRLALTGGQVM